MADFDEALEYVLKNEGGWSDDPDDPGGATNYGITLAVAQRHGIESAEELRDMPKSKAAEIYKKDYWRFGDFIDQRLATKVFDIAVNMGMGPAVQILQCVLTIWGADVDIDGKLGPKTVGAANRAGADRVLLALAFALAGDYRRLAQMRPASRKFLRGWLRRARRLPAMLGLGRKPPPDKE
jgi:type VI secretion system secreted protein VgrG